MGGREAAADFKRRQRIPFPLLVDPEKKTYRALEAGRASLGEILGPSVWIKGARSILRGNWQATAKQDPFQLGATAVVDQSGKVIYLHRAKDASDNAPLEEVLEAVG